MTIFFIRAWYGLLGLIGRFLHWLIIDLPMIRLRNACIKKDKSVDELWDKYHLISWEDTPEVNEKAGMYALNKMSTIRVWFEMHNEELGESDDRDLHLFYSAIGYIKEIISRR